MIGHIHKIGALMICACLTVAGCSSNNEPTALLGASQQVLGAIKAKRATKGIKPAFVQVTPKQLDNTKIPALQVNVLTRGGSDFLKRVARRRAADGGVIAVWQGARGEQLILKEGVLIGTRGIGADIISADAQATIRAVRSARAGQGQRRYFVSTGDYSDQELVLDCRIENLGRGKTQVVHLSFTTVHLQETCVGGASDQVRIVNDFWVEPKTGLVRRSKQWVGPLSGGFELILLRNS